MPPNPPPAPPRPALSAVGTAAEQQRWQACLDTMHLTGQQQEALLLNRRSHLQRMRSIYQERHNLNMQVGRGGGGRRARAGGVCVPARGAGGEARSIPVAGSGGAELCAQPGLASRYSTTHTCLQATGNRHVGG